MSFANIPAITDRFLGAPFVRHGRSPDGVDCLGLVLCVLGFARGRPLPDPVDGRRYQDLVREFSPIEVGDAVVPGDVVWMKARGSDEAHLAIVESTDWIVDCSSYAGVYRVRRDEAIACAQGAYRLREWRS